MICNHLADEDSCLLNFNYIVARVLWCNGLVFDCGHAMDHLLWFEFVNNKMTTKRVKKKAEKMHKLFSQFGRKLLLKILNMFPLLTQKIMGNTQYEPRHDISNNVVF